MLRKLASPSGLLMERTSLYSRWNNAIAGPSLSRTATTDTTFRASESTERSIPVERTSPPKKFTKDFRSLHREDFEKLRPRLRPQVLSLRVLDLVENSKMDEAIKLVRTSPADAQSAPVWGTLFKALMKASRYQAAWDLYVDMKRRGVKPNAITCTTMMKGWTQIEDWKQYSKQLKHCHTVWEDYERWVEAVKIGTTPDNLRISSPFPAYIKILASNGLQEKITELIYAMDDSGRFAPNEFVYAALFQALVIQSSVASPEDHEAATLRSASDAKFLWRQMQRARENQQFPIDAFIVNPALTVLARGRSSEQMLAFEIAQEHLGLSRPGEPPRPATSALTSQTAGAALRLCTITQKYRLCTHFYEQLVRNHTALIRRSHVCQALAAYGGLAHPGSSLEPQQAVELIKWLMQQEALGTLARSSYWENLEYNTALTVCQKGADWGAAMEVFYLLTGYRASAFTDSAKPSRFIKRESRSEGKLRDPDLNTFLHLTRTAWATHDRSDMRQCLRIIDFFGVMKSKLVQDRLTALVAESLAEDVIQTVDHVLSNRASVDDASAKRWAQLKKNAEDVLKRAGRTYEHGWTPQEPWIGSRSALDMMDEALEFEMATRHA